MQWHLWTSTGHIIATFLRRREEEVIATWITMAKVVVIVTDIARCRLLVWKKCFERR